MTSQDSRSHSDRDLLGFAESLGLRSPLLSALTKVLDTDPRHDLFGHKLSHFAASTFDLLVLCNGISSTRSPSTASGAVRVTPFTGDCQTWHDIEFWYDDSSMLCLADYPLDRDWSIAPASLPEFTAIVGRLSTLGKAIARKHSKQIDNIYEFDFRGSAIGYGPYEPEQRRWYYRDADGSKFGAKPADAWLRSAAECDPR